jgi:hypothetical protein
VNNVPIYKTIKESIVGEKPRKEVPLKQKIKKTYKKVKSEVKKTAKKLYREGMSLAQAAEGDFPSAGSVYKSTKGRYKEASKINKKGY